MDENFELPCENDANSATNDEESRHAGSIPAARSPSESKTYEASVEASVETISPERPEDQDCAEKSGGASGSAKAECDSEPALSRAGAGERTPLATEGGHWYLPDGTPFYTVPRKTKGKNGELPGSPRDVDLRDARKVNAVRSVTGITGLVEKPALNNYREKHIFQATLRLYDKHVGGDMEFFWRDVQVAASEHRDNAADRGHQLHAEIERYLRGEQLYDPLKWWAHVDNLVNALAQYGIDIHEGCPEKSFAHPLGFGGKVDWHRRRIDPLVLDVKSKKEIDDKKLQSWCDSSKSMQIAAYRVGLAIPNARGINVFVGEEDREIRIFEWTKSDLKEAWEKFQLLLQFWKKENHYYPKIP